MLKRYPVGSEVPAAEWEGLRFANDAGLMSPRPLALDASGEWFGSPALVIDAIPGRPDVAPRDANAYVNDVATAMANIHATSVVNAEGVLLRSHSVDRWTAPTTSRTGSSAVQSHGGWSPPSETGSRELTAVSRC